MKGTRVLVTLILHLIFIFSLLSETNLTDQAPRQMGHKVSLENSDVRIAFSSHFLVPWFKLLTSSPASNLGSPGSYKVMISCIPALQERIERMLNYES